MKISPTEDLTIYARLEAKDKQRKRLAREARSYIFSGSIGVQGERLIFCCCCLIPVALDLLSLDNGYRKPFWRQVQAIKRYLLEKSTPYILPPLVIAVDEEYEIGIESEVLTLFPGAEIKLVDGQRRKEALVKALAENPELADESIGIQFVFGCSKGAKWSTDINSNQARMKRCKAEKGV